MRKLMMLGLFGAMAMSAVAQGTVQFQNSVFSPVRVVHNGNGGVTNSAAASDGLVIGLFYGTTAGTATNLIGTATILGTNGIFSGSVVFGVPGSNPGDIGFFNVAAWELFYGTTVQGMWNALGNAGIWGSPQSGGIYGNMGTPLQFTLAPTVGPGTAMFGNSATPNVFHSFLVFVPDPEPSTLSLVGLGTGMLLMFRRRK